MRLSRIFLFLFLCGFSLLTHAQSIVCHVTGRVEDPKEKYVLIFEDFEALRADRFIKVAIRNGRFICDIQTKKPKCYSVVLESEHEKGTMRVADFIIEPADVQISIPRASDKGDAYPHEAPKTRWPWSTLLSATRFSKPMNLGSGALKQRRPPLPTRRVKSVQWGRVREKNTKN